MNFKRKMAFKCDKPKRNQEYGNLPFELKTQPIYHTENDTGVDMVKEKGLYIIA